VAIEIASDHVTVVQISVLASGPVVTAHALVPLEPGLVVPGLAAPNIQRPAEVMSLLERALSAAGLGHARRVALVIPDSVARVSLIALDEVPSRAADFDQLVRWHVRKSTPFQLEDAQLSHFIASRGPGKSATVAAIVARKAVVAEYEAITRAKGMHAGLVDLASLNVMNAVAAAGQAPSGDWLLVHLSAEATTLAILRGPQLLFYRHRAAADEESLLALVHQTAMYHEDRLGGGTFARVSVCGVDTQGAAVDREISERLGVPVSHIDLRPAVNVNDRLQPSAALLDALAAPAGALLRARAAA
jgi:Tfp pilus assembly PilM family ATPase